MSRKRMFDNEIINQDSFFDLPTEAKALYFLLGMEADDEGFVSPKRILRLHGISDDSLKLLIVKEYLIPFESGVVVITDWKRNNYLDKNRIRETIYVNEKKQISYNEEKVKYVFVGETANPLLPNVKQMLNESLTDVKPVENSIVENRGEKNSIKIKKTKPTLEEIKRYIEDKKLNVDANDFFQYFEEGNWIDSKGNKVKNWKQKLLTWNRYRSRNNRNSNNYNDNHINTVMLEGLYDN